jgi:putative ABC transport system ATP-binding protein
VHALAGVSLDFPAGEFAAIMGPSGSGKSSLLHLLGGLDRPTSGEVVVGGESLSGLSDRKLTLLRRERMGFVFQFFNLIPTLSAEENILLPLMISGEDTREHAGRLAELLDLVGLSGRREHRPDELSGGEQQRVAIARAMVRNPDIILADEPTGNLDSKTGTGVLDLLRESAARYGQTVIMVTHDPRAAAYADRVVFLSDGKVVDEVRDADPDRILERVKTLESAP